MGESRSLFAEIEDLLRYRKRELAKLLVGTVALAVLGYGVALMAAEGWTERGLSWHLAYGVADLIGVEAIVFFMFFVGGILGLEAVIIADRFKRFQGILLLVGTIAGGAALEQVGVLVDVIQLTIPVVLAVLVGAGITISTTVWLVVSGSDGPYRFTPAIQGMVGIVGVITVVGFLEAFVDYESPLVYTADGLVTQGVIFNGLSDEPSVFGGLVAGVVLLVILWKFLSYESRANAVIIGPTGAGKTWLMAGLHYTVHRESTGDAETPPTEPNDNMRRLHRYMVNRDFHRFGPNEEDELEPLKFQYIRGRIFPRIVTLYALDHAGEFLKRLDVDDEDYEPEAESLEEAFANASEKEGRTEVEQCLSDFIYYADNIGMLLPMEDFSVAETTEEDTGGTRDRIAPSEYVGKYESLVSRFRNNAPRSLRKRMFLIVTKADKVQTEFRRKTGKSPDDDPAHFQTFIETEYINGDSGALASLYEQPHIAGQSPVPTYFDTDPDDPYVGDGSGNIAPNLKTDDDRPPLRGAERVLNRLGRS